MEEVQELSEDQKIGIRIIFSILGLFIVGSFLAFYNEIPVTALNNRETVETAFAVQSLKVSDETSESEFDVTSEIYGEVSTSEGGIVYVVDPKTRRMMAISTPKLRYAPEGDILISGTLNSYTMKLKVDDRIIAVYDSKTRKTSSNLAAGSWSQLPIVP